MTECDRCSDPATVWVETRSGSEELCAGCATVMIQDGYAILGDSHGSVCEGIRHRWAISKLLTGD